MAEAERLLVVGVKWPPETFIRRRLEGLAARGFSVDVAVSEASGPIGGERPGLRVFRLPPSGGSAFTRVLRLVSSFGRGALRSPSAAVRFAGAALQSESRSANLRRLLPFAGLDPDIIHFEWNFAATEYLPLFDLFGKPVVISCRGAQVQVATANPARRKQADLLPVTFQKAAAVHCVSNAILREAIEYGLDPAKACIIRPAVDPEVFRPAVSSPEHSELRIAMTGAPIWRKGYEYALLAVRGLLDHGIPARLDIVGGGSHADLQRLRYTVQDLSLEAVVHLRGSLAPPDVADVLRQSDVFLLTSLSEGISNAVLEGMSCGLPAVTTDCGGMREAVSDGVEGFVVPVRAPLETARALETLARDPELRRRMGRAARARILAEFTLERQIDAWVELYRSLGSAQKEMSPAAEGRARLERTTTV